MKKVILLSAGTLALLAASCDCGNTCDKNEGKCETSSTQVVIDNIMTRASVRQFTGAPIGKDTLETLVKTGMAAPTARNQQPWGFIVVDEKEVLDSLNSVHPYANLKNAAAAIVVCGDMEHAIEGEGRDYWIQDCSAASENILLAAHAYGLGAVWCGVYPTAERVKAVSNVLSIPDNVVPLNIITLGHPLAPSAPKDKYKEENVHYNKW